MRNLQSLLKRVPSPFLGASTDFSKLNGRPLKHLLDKGYAESSTR